MDVKSEKGSIRIFLPLKNEMSGKMVCAVIPATKPIATGDYELQVSQISVVKPCIKTPKQQKPVYG